METKDEPEYVVVTVRTLKVLLWTESWQEARKLANLCRAAGGEVIIYKGTKG